MDDLNVENFKESLGAPIQRRAISEHVTQRLLNLIQAGVLKPGQKLPTERELAEMLGVGRPTLREALRALALLGIIVKRQGDGVFISALDPESMLAPLHFFVGLKPHHLDALFEARFVIEAGIASLAAERLTAETIELLQSCIAQGEKSVEDPAKFLEVDVEFHRLISEGADSPFLQRVAQSLHILGKASREITVQLPGIRQQVHADHQKILEALVNRNPAQASESMLRHLKNVQEAYHRHRSQTGGDGCK